MLLLAAKLIPRGEQWLYELKFDGFRGVAVKDANRVRLLSRNQRDLSKRFSAYRAGGC
jgi:bifunctional non-homologous end joining protein LigD